MERLSRVVGPVATNVHVLADRAPARRSPSTRRSRRLAWIADELAARDWTLKLIVSTHGHWDHIGDNAAVAAHTGARDRRPSARPGAADRSAAALRAVRHPAVGAGGRAGGGRRHPVRRDPAARAPHARPHRGLGLPAGRRRRACCSAATRCSPAAGAGWTCPAATRRRWSTSLGRLSASRTTSASSPATAPTTTIGRERAWMELVRDGGRLLA